MYLPDLGRRIRTQREKRKLKQQDIANALNISPQAVSKWERGENAPDIALLAPLSKVLDVTVDWILAAHEAEKDVIEGTVMVSSFSGAYQKSLGMPPRDFATWANSIFMQLTEAALHNGGVPIKYMGDRFLCFFSGTEHADRGLKAVAQSKRLIGEPLKIGMATGDVFLGNVGHPDYANTDVMGEAVNLAFLVLEWAEQHSESGVAVSQRVLKTAKRAPKAMRKEDVKFLGLDLPVTIGVIKLTES